MQASGIGVSGTSVMGRGGITPSKPSVIVVQRGLPHHNVSSKVGAITKVCLYSKLYETFLFVMFCSILMFFRINNDVLNKGYCWKPEDSPN